MGTASSRARQKLMELLRLTPEPPMREGYVMALQDAVDRYVRVILHEAEEADDDGPGQTCRKTRGEKQSGGGR